MSGFKLKLCVWELTALCNLRCKHCGSMAGDRQKDELSLNKCLSVADELAALKCETVCLIGGEVTLYPHWDKIADRLISHGIQTNIITNGYGMTTERLKQIEKSKINTVCISIDGMEKNHNYIRGKSDCFQQLKDFIGHVHGMNKYLTAVTTLTKNNIQDIKELYQFLKSNHVKIWQLQLCSPFGNAKKNIDILPSNEDIHYCLKTCHELSKNSIMKIQLADNIGYYFQTSDMEILQQFHGCPAGLHVIGIDSTGNVRGCESLYDERFIEGNLKTETLESIWNNENKFSYNRQFKPADLTGKCSECRHGWICAGGCRSHNYYVHNKMFESRVCTFGRQMQ